MLRKSLVLALALALTVALAFACGPQDKGKEPQERNQGAGGPGGARSGEARRTEPTPLESVQVAYETTASEQTAKITFETTTTGVPTDLEKSGEFRMSGHGVVDFENDASRMTARSPSLGGFEIRQVGGIAYYRLPAELRAQTQGGKPWIEIDLDKMYHERYGVSPSEMQGAQADPTRQLAYLRGVAGSVDKLGTGKVRGTQTTHYRAVVDLDKAAAKGGPKTQRTYDKIERQLGTSKLPVEAWLDGQGRVRRFLMSMTIPLQDAASTGADHGATAKTTIVEEFYDFGTPVEVSPPPPDQTADLAELTTHHQAR